MQQKAEPHFLALRGALWEAKTLAGLQGAPHAFCKIVGTALLWEGVDVQKWGEMEGEARQRLVPNLPEQRQEGPYAAEPKGAELLTVSPEPPSTQLVGDTKAWAGASAKLRQLAWGRVGIPGLGQVNLGGMKRSSVDAQLHSKSPSSLARGDALCRGTQGPLAQLNTLWVDCKCRHPKPSLNPLQNNSGIPAEPTAPCIVLGSLKSSLVKAALPPALLPVLTPRQKPSAIQHPWVPASAAPLQASTIDTDGIFSSQAQAVWVTLSSPAILLGFELLSQKQETLVEESRNNVCPSPSWKRRGILV